MGRLNSKSSADTLFLILTNDDHDDDNDADLENKYILK